MNDPKNAIKIIAAKIYEAIRDEFAPNDKTKFSEINEDARNFYYKHALTLLLFSDLSWKYFAINKSDDT